MTLTFHSEEKELQLFDEKSIKEVRLSDHTGRTFFSNYVNSNQCVIKTVNIRSGIYILTVYKEDGSRWIKGIEIG